MRTHPPSWIISLGLLVAGFWIATLFWFPVSLLCYRQGYQVGKKSGYTAGFKDSDKEHLQHEVEIWHSGFDKGYNRGQSERPRIFTQSP